MHISRIMTNKVMREVKLYNAFFPFPCWTTLSSSSHFQVPAPSCWLSSTISLLHSAFISLMSYEGFAWCLIGKLLHSQKLTADLAKCDITSRNIQNSTGFLGNITVKKNEISVYSVGLGGLQQAYRAFQCGFQFIPQTFAKRRY